MPMVELLRHIATKGGFGPGDPDKLARRELRRIRKAGTDSEDEFQMRDGRVIHVQRNSMPDGGHASTYTDITERRRAEAAFQESEERLRYFVDTSPFGVSIVSRANRKRLYVNHRFVEMLGGRSDEEILNWPAVESYSNPSKREQNWAAFERDDVLPSTEEQRKRLDGTTWWCLTDWRPIVFEGKEAVINWHYDITERKQAEEALRESQARLANILDNSPAPIYFKDTEGRFLVANRRYQKMYDVKFEDFKGKTSKEIFGDELGEVFFDHDQEVLNSPKAIEREENIFGRTYLTLKFPIVDHNGVLLGLGGIETDITERKLAELALRESEEKYRLMAESTDVIPWEVDVATFQFTYVAPQVEKLLGYPVEDWSQDDFWLTHMHPDDREATYATCLEATERGEDNDFEYRMIAADGRTVWLRDIVKFIRGDNGSDLLRGVLINITERKRMEEALVESEERHRHFSADVAHELRTPIAVLRSHLDNLENTETIQSLSKDVDAMSRLVSQLLETTRLDSLTVNPNDQADLHAIGTEVAKNLAPFAIREGRSIEMTGAQDPVKVRGNDDALEMAVRNLVENAIRYSARKTMVTIHVSDEPAISVIDHGRGIPPEQKNVIFQRFKRADQRSGGAGLGLSIVQRVVEIHQATIDVSDAPGGGTVFKISFPAAKLPKAVAN